MSMEDILSSKIRQTKEDKYCMASSDEVPGALRFRKIQGRVVAGGEGWAVCI